MLTTSKLATLLSLLQPEFRDSSSHQEDSRSSAEQNELQWLVVGKATMQLYGNVLQVLLSQASPIASEMWYWEEVIGSYTYTALYSVQTAPIRLWHWLCNIFRDVQQQLQSTRQQSNESTYLSQVRRSGSMAPSYLAKSWTRFYVLVRESAKARSLKSVEAGIMVPISFSRNDAMTRLLRLKRLRATSACGLGILSDEGLSFDVDEADDEVASTLPVKTQPKDSEEWKAVVEKSVILLENVLRRSLSLDLTLSEFEDAVFSGVEQYSNDPEPVSIQGESGNGNRPMLIIQRLQAILDDDMPRHVSSFNSGLNEHGRPSRAIRYWLPACAFLFSASTVFRIVLNRKVAIMTWIQEAGATSIDFWMNWVVEPVKKIVGTIRHDKESEVAIMSRASLEGDRASLERMVVDFAVDNPQTSGKASLDATEIEAVRNGVKEGDLTPVLKAYEKDLRRPFMGTVRGELVRALLIQIQKTKVDVEVAIGGIDAILKSQELVFG